MYQVAYELFSRNIRIKVDDLRHIPPAWLGYYQRLLEELSETHKHITIDEYHRTIIGGRQADPDQFGLRATLLREGGREARKWSLSTTTISQKPEDHGRMFSMATANHILKQGSSDDMKYMRERLEFSDTEMLALKSFVTGPGKDGVTFLTQWTVNGSDKFSQLFTSSIGPKTLWSLSTTFEDKQIRGMVFEGLGRTSGRAVLAQHFPGGTAKSEVALRKRAYATSLTKDAVVGACREIADELIQAYRSRPMDYENKGI